MRNLREIRSAARAGPDARRQMTRRYVHDGLRHVVPYVGVETGGAIMFSATADRTAGRALYSRGWWDPEGLPNALARAGLNIGGRLVVEVGANIGTTTVQAARMGAQVLAFEPETTNYRLLRANVAVNQLDDRVECVHAGCSSETRLARMALSDVNPGAHRIADDGDAEVLLVRVDDALRERGISASEVALLWLDAEGHEVDVLAGASDLLSARPVVLTEFWPKAIAHRLGEFEAMIADYTTIVDMSTGDVTTLTRAAETHRHGLTDLLLLPEIVRPRPAR